MLRPPASGNTRGSGYEPIYLQLTAWDELTVWAESTVWSVSFFEGEHSVIEGEHSPTRLEDGHATGVYGGENVDPTCEPPETHARSRHGTVWCAIFFSEGYVFRFYVR